MCSANFMAADASRAAQPIIDRAAQSYIGHQLRNAQIGVPLFQLPERVPSENPVRGLADARQHSSFGWKIATLQPPKRLGRIREKHGVARIAQVSAILNERSVPVQEDSGRQSVA